MTVTLAPVPRRMTAVEKAEVLKLLGLTIETRGLHFELRCHYLAEDRNRERYLKLLAWAVEQPCEGESGKEDDGQPCVDDDPEFVCLPCLARKWSGEDG